MMSSGSRGILLGDEGFKMLIRWVIITVCSLVNIQSCDLNVNCLQGSFCSPADGAAMGCHGVCRCRALVEAVTNGWPLKEEPRPWLQLPLSASWVSPQQAWLPWAVSQHKLFLPSVVDVRSLSPL